MIDTNHIEVLREIRRVYIDPETIAALDAAITALSARASAGEGGITAEFVTGYMMAPIGNPDAWPENYANGFNDCAKTCAEQVLHAFGEWEGFSMIPAPISVERITTELDALLATQGATEYGVALLDFMRLRGMDLRALLHQLAERDEVEGADMREFERRNAAFVNALPRKIDGSNSQPAGREVVVSGFSKKYSVAFLDQAKFPPGTTVFVFASKDKE